MNWKRRVILFYVPLLSVLYGAFLWQPYEYDLIPRKKSHPGHADPTKDGLFARGARVLIVTAHPDDAEFYIGALLMRLSETGAVVQLVACTDGDKGYYTNLFTNVEENRKVRRQEQTEACKKWKGLQPHFLGFPDGRLPVNDEVQAAIVREMESFRPDFVMSFDGDYPPRTSHRDHRHAGLNAQAALYKWNKAKWLLRFSSNSPNWYANVEGREDQLLDLLSIHKSQFHGEKLTRVWSMVLSIHEEEGKAGGFELAEGFRCEPVGR